MSNTSTSTDSQPVIPVTKTNIDPYLGIAASVLLFAGGFFVSKGWLDNQQLVTIISAILSLAATIYVAYKNTTSSKIASLSSNMNISKEALTRHLMTMRRNS